VIQIRFVLVNSSKYPLNEEILVQVSDLIGILEQYRNASVANPPQSVQQDYQRTAEAVPSSHLADALGEAFRSGETPPFGQMLSNLFAGSNPDQRAGILNQLLSAVGPGTLGSVALGSFAGLLRGSNTRVSPEQAKQVSRDHTTTGRTRRKTESFRY
jgi:hypothetical protein